MRFLAGVPNFVLGTVAIGVLLLLVFPLAIVIPLSFSATSGLEFPPPRYGFGRYAQLLASPQWLAAVSTSLRIAVTTSVVATVLGAALAISLLRGRLPGKEALNTLVLAPLIVPTIIYAVALFFAFRQLDLYDNGLALSLAYTVIAIPYVVLLTSARLKSFDESLETAAMSLGAPWWRALWKVTLPLTWTAILAAALFSFIIAFDELLIALFVTGFRTETLPRKMFESFTNEVDPLLSVISTLLIVFSLAVGSVATLATRARA